MKNLPSIPPARSSDPSIPMPPRTPDRLVLLANDAIRARRRPLAITLVFAYEALLGAVLASPMTAWIRSAYGAHPEGDAPLWRPGGLALFDLLARAQVFSALSSHVLFVLAIGTMMGLLPLAFLVTSMAYTTPERRSPPLHRVIARAAPSFVPLVVLFVVMAIVQTVVLGLGLVAAGALTKTSSMGEVRGQQAAVAVLLVFLLFVAIVGVVHDVARAAAIRFEVGALKALALALKIRRRSMMTALVSWGWRATVAWIPVAMGAFVAHRLGGRAGWALVVLLALHQLVILSRVALRASWLAKAVRLVDQAHGLPRGH